MRVLSFMGPSNDGQRLLLVSEDGTEFELVVDQRLISVITREHGASKQAPAKAQRAVMPSPREIQDRIRHGAAIEDIASAAGVEPDSIARFAHPVLTERGHIALAAQETSISTPTGQAPLDAVVTDRLRTRGIDIASLRWDSWRNPDTTWTVVVAYSAAHGEQLATFAFNPAFGTVIAADDQARWIIEEGSKPKLAPSPQGVPSPSPTPSPSSRPAPAPAPSQQGQQGSQGHQEQPARSERWDSSHPAAKAAAAKAQRASDTAASANATASADKADASKSEANKAQPTANSDKSAGSTANIHHDEPHAKRPSQPERKAAAPPHWEELLFGTPTNED